MLEDLGCQCESFQHPPPNQHHPSLESFMRFCISFIDSIINAINSNDFSVNAADESPADVFSPLWGSAASLDLWEPLPLPSGGLSASLPKPVVTPTAGRCELMGFLGVYRPPFWGVFQAGHQSHLELQTADLHPTFETPTHLPFPSGADSPSKLFSKFLLNSRFSLSTSMLLSCPCPWKPLDPTRPSSCILRSSCSRKRGRWTGGKNCPGGIRDKEGSLRDMLWI